MIHLNRVGDAIWEIPRQGEMRVPARIYATEAMIADILADKAPLQAMNVAHLPGIVKYSLAMPDIHWGYGFPVGGVAAFDIQDGIISPGGVGYDINCGVRLLASKLDRAEVEPRIKDLIAALFYLVPTGVGCEGNVPLAIRDEKKMLTGGAQWAVRAGYGSDEDIEYIEENGCSPDADFSRISDRAMTRGRPQLGTLGSGNHFLEVGYVSEIYDEDAARVLGLFPGSVTVIIHCGSRGFGYQVCDDHIRLLSHAAANFGFVLPDRQLACAPIRSAEGEHYFSEMRCAINYAFANRQIIASRVRDAFQETLKKTPNEIGLRTVYEVAHNIAKIEKHSVDGVLREVCVHRKGATRAFAPGSPEIPAAYKNIGQPVLIPGDMGRYSYVLAGTKGAMEQTFGSTCHGAGRRMSRRQAKKAAGGRSITKELLKRGIHVMASSLRTIDEEISEAYKDVAEVVDACVLAGISRKVAQLKPLGCIKG